MPFLGPLGAPVPSAPACNRHLPCFVFGDWQSFPRRVLAKQRGARRKGKGCRVNPLMRLSFDMGYSPLPGSHLTADVHVTMGVVTLEDDFLVKDNSGELLASV
jgi:hypothetical protein